MGNFWSVTGLNKDHCDVQKFFWPHYWKENWPSNLTDSPYAPLDGFPNGRKPRGKNP